MSSETQQAETALNAYLSLLKSKGAATSVLNVRKHMLRHLISALEAQSGRFISDDDAGYRRAVDSVILAFPNDQRVEIINVAREFYPFWVGDLRTISRLNAANAWSVEAVTVDVSGTLVQMFERMDEDVWSQQTPDSLARYLEALLSRGADAAVVDVRERLLMLLLFVIRNADPIPTAYRAGVDAMLTLFTKEDTRRVFIDVAREFFHYWQGFHNPGADTSVQAA